MSESNMTVHSPETVVLGSTALLVHLVKILGAKGVLTDEDWRKVIGGAVNELDSHEDGQPVIDFIQTLTQVQLRRDT